jgi:hypothetical protein
MNLIINCSMMGIKLKIIAARAIALTSSKAQPIKKNDS